MLSNIYIYIYTQAIRKFVCLKYLDGICTHTHTHRRLFAFIWQKTVWRQMHGTEKSWIPAKCPSTLKREEERRASVLECRQALWGSSAVQQSQNASITMTIAFILVAFPTIRLLFVPGSPALSVIPLIDDMRSGVLLIERLLLGHTALLLLLILSFEQTPDPWSSKPLCCTLEWYFRAEEVLRRGVFVCFFTD